MFRAAAIPSSSIDFTFLYPMRPLRANGSATAPLTATAHRPAERTTTIQLALKADPHVSFFAVASTHFFASYESSFLSAFADRRLLARSPRVMSVAEMVGEAVSRGGPQRLSTIAPMPSLMVHMASVRTGAWARRAMLRAHGWWYPEADAIVAETMGWGRRRGLLRVGGRRGRGVVQPATALQYDLLIGNLLLLAAAANLTAVLPETLCELPAAQLPALTYSSANRQTPTNPRNVSGQLESRCAYQPSRGCWRLEYMTEMEWERRGRPDAFHATEALAAVPLLAKVAALATLSEADLVDHLMQKPLLSLPKKSSGLQWARAIDSFGRGTGATILTLTGMTHSASGAKDPRRGGKHGTSCAGEVVSVCYHIESFTTANACVTLRPRCCVYRRYIFFTVLIPSGMWCHARPQKVPSWC